jgi:hypothetical protein
LPRINITSRTAINNVLNPGAKHRHARTISTHPAARTHRAGAAKARFNNLLFYFPKGT